MAAQLNPYLQFNNTAREAMEFYASVLGGTPEIMTFGDMDPNAGDIASGVMHAYLETPDGFALMASDTPPGMPLREGSAISVSLSGTDASLRDYFAGLAEGGEVTMPLEKQMWGDEFGMLTDKFGIAWMVNVSSGNAPGPDTAQA